MKPIKNKTMVVNKNELIERRIDSMTLFEKRVLLLAMAQIKREDNNFKEYSIKLKDMINIFKINSNSIYDNMGKIINSLRKKGFDYKFMNSDGENRIGSKPWFSQIEYDNKIGTIFVIFNPILKPMLLGIKNNFTVFYIENIVNLKRYSYLRLYELLYSYRKTGWRQINISKLILFMGIEKNKVKLYSNFKRMIIKSINEINEKTDIKISFNEIKEVRKVVALKFKITTKPKPESHKKIEKLYNKKVEHGYTTEEKAKLKEDFDITFIGGDI